MAGHDGHCEDVPGVLSAYIDGDLSERECEKLASHLEACEDCQEILRSVEATRDGIGKLGEKLILKEGETAECIEKCMKFLKARLGGGRSSDAASSREDRNQSH